MEKEDELSKADENKPGESSKSGKAISSSGSTSPVPSTSGTKPVLSVDNEPGSSKVMDKVDDSDQQPDDLIVIQDEDPFADAPDQIVTIPASDPDADKQLSILRTALLTSITDEPIVIHDEDPFSTFADKTPDDSESDDVDDDDDDNQITEKFTKITKRLSEIKELLSEKFDKKPTKGNPFKEQPKKIAKKNEKEPKKSGKKGKTIEVDEDELLKDDDDVKSIGMDIDLHDLDEDDLLRDDDVPENDETPEVKTDETDKNPSKKSEQTKELKVNSETMEIEEPAKPKSPVQLMECDDDDTVLVEISDKPKEPLNVEETIISTPITIRKPIRILTPAQIFNQFTKSQEKAVEKQSIDVKEPTSVPKVVKKPTDEVKKPAEKPIEMVRIPIDSPIEIIRLPFDKPKEVVKKPIQKPPEVVLKPIEKPKEVKKPIPKRDILIIDLSDDSDDGKPTSTVEIKSTTASKPDPVDKSQKTDEKTESVKEKSNDSIKKPETKKRKLPRRPSADYIYKGKECINCECKRTCKVFYVSPLYALSYYNIPRKPNRQQYICEDCLDGSVDSYGSLVATLEDCQPLLIENLPKKAELVEILDSSDEDDANPSKKVTNEHLDCLDDEIRTVLEENFDDLLAKTFERIQIDQQLSWSKQILTHRMETIKQESDELGAEIKAIQKMADSMYSNLYRHTGNVIEELAPFDLNTGTNMQLAGPHYPVVGDLVRAPLRTHQLYYAVRTKLLAAWVPCKYIGEFTLQEQTNRKLYKVKFLRNKNNSTSWTKNVAGTHLAYGTSPTVRLQVGVRVIALFQMDNPVGTVKKNDPNTRGLFFPGIIAEPLSSYNRYRYLIFFDDGYAQYASPDNVRLVFEESKNVWEDMDAQNAHFMRDYLNQYSSQRPMVQVRRGQRVMTEWRGKNFNAVVHAIDSSLVNMCFKDGDNGNPIRYEWMYRGSHRFEPLRLQKQSHGASKSKRNEPYVEYMSSEDGRRLSRTIETPVQVEEVNTPTSTPPPQRERRAVARKSTTPITQQAKPSPVPPPSSQFTTQKSTGDRPQVQHLNEHIIYVEEDNKPKGTVVYFKAKKQPEPKLFDPHTCNPSCLFPVRHNLNSYSPLSKPLLSGWEREICKFKNRKDVVYRGPCGRRIRDFYELYNYLRMTKCSLNVENFDFDGAISCLAEYVIRDFEKKVMDLSEGVENMAVQLVNYYDKTMPPPCIYSAKRIPTEGVNLNLDTDFLCGCDCEDDCLDKSKCQCWQLTVEGAITCNKILNPNNIGYTFKRLDEPVPTGIYECNARCKCSMRCLNRVVQHPLQMRLQVFKTGNRGWGLRCMNDVPKGSFICIYAGDLLTEHNANEAGDNYGDEYFAELDYIEVVEGMKQGYEAEVVNEDDDIEEDKSEDDDDFDPTSETRNDRDSDDDDFVTRATIVESSTVKTRYGTRKQSIDVGAAIKKAEIGKVSRDGSDEENEEREAIQFAPDTTNITSDKPKYKSVRRMYGKNEFCYVMDAKRSGNIGRYFNHSCQPNLFVQNVFVDTHDLRFPWVAFFALSHIRAGTELTWNYNYDVGSVPGKVLYCQCGAEQCRGRLL